MPAAQCIGLAVGIPVLIGILDLKKRFNIIFVVFIEQIGIVGHQGHIGKRHQRLQGSFGIGIVFTGKVYFAQQGLGSFFAGATYGRIAFCRQVGGREIQITDDKRIHIFFATSGFATIGICHGVFFFG